MSSWINHVKKFSKTHNIPYSEALRHQDIKMGYKRIGKGGCTQSKMTKVGVEPLPPPRDILSEVRTNPMYVGHVRVQPQPNIHPKRGRGGGAQSKPVIKGDERKEYILKRLRWSVPDYATYVEMLKHINNRMFSLQLPFLTLETPDDVEWFEKHIIETEKVKDDKLIDAINGSPFFTRHHIQLRLEITHGSRYEGVFKDIPRKNR